MRRIYRGRWSVAFALAAVVLFSATGIASAAGPPSQVPSARRTMTTLKVLVRSIPAGLAAPLTVTGPDHFRRRVVKSSTFRNVHAGTYVATAAVLTSTSGSYYPAAAKSHVALRTGRTGTLSVDYATFVPTTTRAVPASATAEIQGPTDGARVLTLSGTAASTTTVGNILASGPTTSDPDGYLVKVSHVVSSANGRVVLDVVPATLREALPEGEINLNASLGEDTLSPRLGGASRPAYTATLSTQYLECAGGQFSVVPSVVFDPSISLHVKWLGSVDSASLTVTLNQSLGLNATIKAGASCSKTIPLLAKPVTLPPVLFSVGPIPLTLRSNLQVDLDANASVSGDLTANIGESYSPSLEIDYANGAFSATTHFPSPMFTKGVVPTASAIAGAYLVPSVTSLIDGLAGPSFDVGAGLKVSLDSTKTPWGELDGCIEAGVGFDIDVLGWKKSWSKPDLVNTCALLLSTGGSVGSGSGGSGGGGAGSGSGGTGSTGGAGGSGSGSGTGGAGGGSTGGTLMAQSLVSDGGGYCALLSTEGAECWGDNTNGELGDGVDAATKVPVAVSGLTNATSLVSIGEDFGYCALLSSGGAECWGAGGDGFLGDGGSAPSDVPVTVSGLTGATSLASDGSGYCALLSSGAAKCWGLNIYGQLGDGGTEYLSVIPVTVSGLTDAMSLVSNGAENGYCALLSSGGAKCWGDDTYDQLGDGGTETFSNVPVTVSGLTSATSLTSGGNGYCALLSSGGAKCWGNDSSGELGDGGTEASSNVPVTVSGLTGATSLTSGGGSYCALLSSGGAKCWGDDGFDELGDGGAEASSNVPVTVSGLTDATSLASDRGNTYCVLLSSGGAKCWGENLKGELGDGGTEASNVPVTVSGLTDATSLVGGGGYGSGYCAMLPNGDVRCWGDNADGELGDGGAEAYSDVPVKVVGLGM